MTRNEKILCAVYLAIALIALVATWSNNLAFIAQPHAAMTGEFFRDAYATPAAASFSNDLLMLTIAACIFMVIEARRLQIRFVALYIVLSAAVAVSVMFPLFLIARQRKLAARRDADACKAAAG
jgi:hypothetical protein